MTTGIRAGANASDTRLAIIGETVWGTTPATPAFKVMRYTSENLQPEKQTVRSNEIEPNRNVKDEILVGRNINGNIDGELSNGVLDTILESLFFNTWTTNSIVNGAGEGTSMTAERTLKMPDGTSEYHRFQGLVANSLSLNIAAGEIVTFSADLMGKTMTRAATIVTGATYVAAGSDGVINAADNFASLSIAGLTGGAAPLVQSISLNITNNLRGQQAVGNIDNVGIATGRFEVTGSMELYANNPNVMTAFLAHSDLGLSFILGKEANKKYRFSIPSIVTTGSPGFNAGGNDQDVTATLAFTGILDRNGSPIGGTIKVDRTVA